VRERSKPAARAQAEVGESSFDIRKSLLNNLSCIFSRECPMSLMLAGHLNKVYGPGFRRGLGFFVCLDVGHLAILPSLSRRLLDRSIANKLDELVAGGKPAHAGVRRRADPRQFHQARPQGLATDLPVPQKECGAAIATIGIDNSAPMP
jgi:hypothetical protein